MVTRNYFRERDLFGFVYGYDFIITGKAMSLVWSADVGVSPDLITGSKVQPTQAEIEAGPRHRDILLARVNLDEANVKLATTLVRKLGREWDVASEIHVC